MYKSLLSCILAFLISIPFCQSQLVSSNTLYGVIAGQLVEIDQNTAEATLIGDTGFPVLFSLVWHQDFEVLLSISLDGGIYELVEIDPETGQGTSLGTIELTDGSPIGLIEGFSYNPVNQSLYIGGNSDPWPSPSNELYELQMDGTANFLFVNSGTGSCQNGDIDDMGFNNAGELLWKDGCAATGPNGVIELHSLNIETQESSVVYSEGNYDTENFRGFSRIPNSSDILSAFWFTDSLVVLDQNDPPNHIAIGHIDPQDNFGEEHLRGLEFIANTDLEGIVFYDVNQNQVHEEGEPFLSNVELNLDNGSVSLPINGSYQFAAGLGWHTVSYTTDPFWGLTTDSASYTVLIDSLTMSYDSLDFGFYPTVFFTRYGAELTGGLPRCNTVANYWVNLLNIGTNLPSGIIELNLDPQLTYVSSEVMPDSIVDQNYYWHFDSLELYGQFMLNIQVEMPTVDAVGDTINSVLTVTEIDDMGNIGFTRSDSLSQIIICAVDPNDKLVEPRGAGEEGYIQQEQDLDYTIRFQNTGTDTAFNVIIRDRISNKLDLSTFEFLASSHDVEVFIEPDREVVFKFDNIMLPDSNVNEPASHGFVKYNINHIEDLPSENEIENTAGIYFDWNPPIITNTTLNTICYDQPMASITLEPDMSLTVSNIPEATFQWFLDGEAIEGENGLTLVPQAEGMYTVEITDDNSCFASFFTPPLVFEFVSIDNITADGFNVAIYPNPTDNYSTIAFEKELEGKFDLVVADFFGRIAYTQNNLSGDSIRLWKSNLGTGLFSINLIDRTNGNQYNLGKLMVF
ncbi:MAG: hypothetical protein AAF502_07610 [Bacteroidota bacterium]